jgi:signal transduction histidine kinase
LINKFKDPGLGKGFGLSSRLLVLTILFVMLAEVLIFVPSIANFRNNWLNDRLAAARTAALVLEAAPDDALPEQLVKDLLMSVGAETIALRIKGTRRLLAVNEMPPIVSSMTDMRANSATSSIVDSFRTMWRRGSDALGVIGSAAMEGEFVEIVILEKPLRDAMWRFAGNILVLSLFISAVTAALVFFALKHVIVRPVERLTSNITRFAEKPDDQTRMMQPSGRTDEIGSAETAVAGMQQALSQQLKQKEHLAALGLAVSKINHDLRNMLSSAQLISDRLGGVQDPTVQRFAPKLVQTLDRAIAFCQSTLAYGRAEERPPQLVPVLLHAVMEEARDVAGLLDNHPVVWLNQVPSDLRVEGDPEHLFRIVMNLIRNALQAMENDPPQQGLRHSLSVSAAPEDNGWAIRIQDTGPGIPQHIRPKLFDAFHGSTRPGGSGLGLAIAADLARAQGGDIRLEPSAIGAAFRIYLPRRTIRC